MISATANWIAANANPKKKPIFLIDVEGYARGFTTAPGVGVHEGLPIPFAIHTELLSTGGGLSNQPNYIVNSTATAAGNLLFAFLHDGNGDFASGTDTIGDTAGNTWIRIYDDGVGIAVWYCVSVAVAAGNVITWDLANISNHASSQFYIVEVPAKYAGFSSYAQASGTGATASVALATTTLRVALNAAGSWDIFGIELAPATSASSGITLGFLFLPSNPFSVLYPQDSIVGAFVTTVVTSNPSTGYDWIVSIGDLSLTVSDLEGGAELSDLVFNVQDRAQALTGDMPNFVFEGKECVLKQGFGTVDGYSNRVVFDGSFALADFLTLFTGKIDSVASDNNNDEYTFTVPDVRKDLSKIIYQTADDGFPTDSNHRKTISANPLDILLDILENQVGYPVSQIDVAGITNYRDTIFAGEEFVFSLDSPPAAKDFIENEILKPLGGYHWTDNLGVIRVKFFYPLAPASVATLDHTNLLNVPLASQAGLVTEVTYRFDATTDGKFMAESVQDWGPGIAKYGLFGEQVIESVGLRSGFQGYFMAQFISRLIFLRYGDKQLEIDGLQTIWSQCRLEPGDIIALTSSLVPDRIAGTMGVTAKAFEVLDRSWSLLAGTVTLRVLEIDLSKFKQYLITPNAEAVFTAASPTDQGKYLFLSNAAGKYSTGAAGNTIC